MTEKPKKDPKPNPREAKSTKPQTLQIEISVKVKIDKDCGLPEAGRMVLSRHVEPILEAILGAEISNGKSIGDKYVIVSEKSMRVKNWALLDLRPTKADTQEEIPGTDG